MTLPLSTRIAEELETLEIIDGAASAIDGSCGCPGAEREHTAECLTRLLLGLALAADPILTALGGRAEGLRARIERLRLEERVAELEERGGLP